MRTVPISPPIISMTFGPNDSPIAGKEVKTTNKQSHIRLISPDSCWCCVWCGVRVIMGSGWRMGEVWYGWRKVEVRVRFMWC